MSVTRPVQGSLIAGMERPVGPIPPSVMRGTNADLIAAVADLYLTGSVLDVTYGEGKWWDRFTPSPFFFHDKFKVDGVDFTALPEADNSIDTVCFDPPYVPAGGTSQLCVGERFRTRYGIDRVVGYGAEDELGSLILAGLGEACRVARAFVVVKCMEFVSSRRFHDWPTDITIAARALGWTKHDAIVHHTGSGPGGHNIYEVLRARRHHSYLLVFAPSPFMGEP